MFEEKERNNRSELTCDTETSSIARRLNKSEAWVRLMLIHRQGVADEANMTVHGLHTITVKQVAYRLMAKHGLTQIKHSMPVVDLEEVVTSQHHDRAPQHVVVQAKWGSKIISRDGDGSDNVLGSNVCIELVSAANAIEIPVITANREALLYYNALLVEDRQAVSFPIDNYPIWQVEMGINYVDGFVMTKQGNGFYLEWHKDKPHWHQPLTNDCAGFYLLGRRVGETDSDETYHLTGFHIPFGTAVYSGLGAIHCDATLTGKKWAMGYDGSTNFSTALIRNQSNDMVKLIGRKS